MNFHFCYQNEVLCEEGYIILIFLINLMPAYIWYVCGSDHRIGDGGDDSANWEPIGRVWEEVSAHGPIDSLHYSTRYLYKYLFAYT